jgi:hypothetical protein
MRFGVGGLAADSPAPEAEKQLWKTRWFFASGGTPEYALFEKVWFKCFL